MFKAYHNENMIYEKNQIATGINSVGLVGVLVYCFREFREINNTIEEMRLEITNLRNNNTENTKRSNIVFNQLSQKLDENTRKVNKTSNLIKKELKEEELKNLTEEVQLKEEVNQADDDNEVIKSAIDSLMIN